MKFIYILSSLSKALCPWCWKSVSSRRRESWPIAFEQFSQCNWSTLSPSVWNLGPIFSI